MDMEMMNPRYLMARAAQCRSLARQAYSPEIAEELEKLARDYELDALVSAQSSGGVRGAAAA